MKALKKWVLVLCLAYPAATNFSCSTAIWQDLRDAALSGAASFVEQATIDLLDIILATGGGG
jgi:hypothetical protein